MRPSDPHQPPPARPNLVSVNRKRAAAGGGILDQIAPAVGAGAATELNARWLVAGCVLVVALVASVAGIAWMNATTQRLLPRAESVRPKAATPAPAPAARIERLAEAPSAAAPLGFEQAPGTGQPTPALPATPPLAQVPATAASDRAAGATALAVRQPVMLAARSSAPAPVRRKAGRRAQARPATAPAAARAQDPDVELISAIRKATEKLAD